MSAAHGKGLLLWRASAGCGAVARGAAPPRHSTQCKPPATELSDGAPEGSFCAGPMPGAPAAEHTWCKSDAAGPAGHSGAHTATASASMHQDTAAPASARLRRRVWRSVGLGYMELRQVTAILPR